MVTWDQVTFAIIVYSTGTERNLNADRNRQGYFEHLLEPLSAEAQARGYRQKPLLGRDLDQIPLVRPDDVVLRVEMATQFTSDEEGQTEFDATTRLELVEDPSSVVGRFRLASIIRSVQVQATQVDTPQSMLEPFRSFLDALPLCSEHIEVTAGIVIRCALAADHDGRHDMQVNWD